MMNDGPREEAKAARESAIAVYSGFRVGAALVAEDGRVFRGCNIENASYGLTMCAERVALVTALAAGVRKFTEIWVVTDASSPATPCGPCRQLVWEYAGNIDVHLSNLQNYTRSYKMSELLPYPFDFRPEER